MKNRIVAGLLLVSFASAALAQLGPPPDAGPRRGPGDPGGPGRPMNGSDGGKRARTDLAKLHPLLAKAVSAIPKLQYTGTRTSVLRFGPDTETRNESVWYDRGRMRVEFGSGSKNAGEIIVNDGKQRLHYMPDLNEIHVRKGGPDGGPDGMGEIMRIPRGKPTVAESAGPKVAGQSTRLLTFKDPRGNRFGTLAIDPDNGMILRREIFDPSGRILASMEFVRVNYAPKFLPGDFKISRAGAKMVSVTELGKRMAKRAGVPFMSLPESTGFILEDVRPIRLGQNRQALSLHYRGKEGKQLTLFIIAGKGKVEGMDRLPRDRASVVERTIPEGRLVMMGNVESDVLDKLINLVR
jgi:outer membrane lipoprotein-sorting protein